MGDFPIQILHPDDPQEIGERASESIPEYPEVLEIPPLAQPLPVRLQPQPIAVTRLEQLFGREEGEFAQFRPAMWSNDRPTRIKRAPGYLVGNIVHTALANWECLEYSEGELLRLLENSARREGVFSDALVDAAERSYRMLLNLIAHDIYQDIQNAQQLYHEAKSLK